MITFLGTDDGIGDIRGAAPMVDPQSRDRIELVTYREAFRRSDWLSGAIIFGDLERLLPFEIVLSTRLWQRFSASGAQVRLLNHPTRSLRRFALLRKLKTLGMQDFDVWRADEDRDDMRFPVLLHGERDHNGPIGGLVRNRKALDRALANLGEEGRALNGILVIEFCETQSPDGLYREFGTFRVGDRLVHRHMFHSIDWCVKRRESPLGEHSRADVESEEEAFMRADQYSPAIGDIFRIAGIDYGRMDYALKDGGIRVWEINTNPRLGSLERYHPGVPIYDRYIGRAFEAMREALLALDPERDDTPFWIEPVRRPAAPAAGAGATGGNWRRLFGGRRARRAGVQA